MASVPAVYLSRLGLRFPNSLLLSIPILRENLGTRVRPVSIASNMAETNSLERRRRRGRSRCRSLPTVSVERSHNPEGRHHSVVRRWLFRRHRRSSSSLCIRVNSANERMLGGGGADGAIHTAAGPELRAACYNVPEVRPGVRCPTGEARITPGFRLPVPHVIHTVGPIYNADGDPEASLRSAYGSSLCLAKENNIQYIAFPAISCGIYRYPFEEAATVAISRFCTLIHLVHFVLFSDDIYSVWLDKANELLRDQ
ncbi:uncharacterized protein LOC130764457 isoform X2 [Actinidia eriantha]|uniref:uncharacterized protein LOC130764457 isoform X2 n=1 Tax=Actinidia eriantha TaxID=165200 RepID=UPI00258B9CD6|nr:uncharacterized protein LOC130764457 isoform X2 [Actinidia eriantha]